MALSFLALNLFGQQLRKLWRHSDSSESVLSLWRIKLAVPDGMIAETISAVTSVNANAASSPALSPVSAASQ